MTHEDYIRFAIKTAEASEREGGVAIGAVLVKSGEIVATGKSIVLRAKDPSCHAEVDGIRNAAQKLDTIDLADCVLYSTLEPCAMCVSCAAWANVSDMYFGAYREDVPENPYEVKGDYSAEQLAKTMQRWDGSQLKVSGGIMREECAKLMASYKNWQKR